MGSGHQFAWKIGVIGVQLNAVEAYALLVSLIQTISRMESAAPAKLGRNIEDAKRRSPCKCSGLSACQKSSKKWNRFREVGKCDVNHVP